MRESDKQGWAFYRGPNSDFLITIWFWLVFVYYRSPTASNASGAAVDQGTRSGMDSPSASAPTSASASTDADASNLVTPSPAAG